MIYNGERQREVATSAEEEEKKDFRISYLVYDDLRIK